jgi:hypothetical protein
VASPPREPLEAMESAAAMLRLECAIASPEVVGLDFSADHDILQLRLNCRRRDSDDARWVHYSLNREALDELNRSFGLLLDLSRL